MLDETAYRRSLRQFLDAEVRPHVGRWEQERHFPRIVIHRLGCLGFLEAAVALPPGQSGVGLHLRTFTSLIEEPAATGCFGLTLSVSLHVGVFLPLVVRLVHPDLREGLVDRALRGELLGAVAVTDGAAAGSDFMGMQTTVTADGDRLILNGHKQYITNAGVADCLVVFARVQPERHFTNFVALLVPAGLPGVQATPVPMDVMKTASVGQVAFDRVELSNQHLLGRRGLGISIFLQSIAVERLVSGIWAAPMALRCLEETRQHCARHMVGTDSLWSRSSVRQQVARAVIQARLVERTVADAEVTGRIDPLQAAMIKAAVPSAMESVIGLCLQLRGARCLEQGSALLRMLNDFRAFGIAGGTTETMLDTIADLWGQATTARASQDG
jgi:alkylation response protein AidB-like acyl-CoA dehydrogenase